MQKRQLGKTDITLSVLGLGTVKFGRNEGVKYPQSFTLPDDNALADLLSLASDLGINYLDTAPAYGESEERLGKLLAGNRQRFHLVSKAGESFIDGKSLFDFSSEGITQSVERSLKRLRTDFLDVLLIHSNGDDAKIIEEDGVFETLERLKASGKIRAFGMSSKTVAGGMKTIEQADVAMVTYHPGYTDELAVIKYAEEKQKGILIKKALASGHLNQLVNEGSADPVAASMQFILSQPGVTSIVIGTINPEHLQHNVAVACG